MNILTESATVDVIFFLSLLFIVSREWFFVPFTVADFLWTRLRLISAENPLNREEKCIPADTMHLMMRPNEKWKMGE